MIPVAVTTGALEARRALDGHSVGVLLDLGSEFTQLLSEDGDAVALLYAELGRSRNLGDALRLGGGDRQDGYLVDQPRNEIGADRPRG